MKNTVYLDNAATTFPKPRTVKTDVARLLSEYCANPGRSSHSLAMKAAEKVYSVRKSIADFFEGNDENVVFTSSATHSINLALKSTLRQGDHVLISDIEHNAVLRPISALSQKGVITFDVYTAYEDPMDQIKEIERRLQPNTALISACHHSNITNFVIPIGAIGRFCKSNGILFLVDAAQSAGTLPISIKRDCIDILCAPSHKGLYGIPGGGLSVFSNRPYELERLSTFIEGGNGAFSENPFMPDFLPDRLESGTLPLPAIVSIGAGLDFLKQHGYASILKKEKALCKEMRSGLLGIDGITVHSKTDGSILLFTLKNEPSEETASKLASYGVCVRGGLHCAPLAHNKFKTPNGGAVRISLGAFNTERDCEYLLYAISRIVKNRN